uniref:NR LBD domain-containing protein n=1 Tax=Loa loa TaxID=7209 RepID=A0A1I7V9A5_LOALO
MFDNIDSGHPELLGYQMFGNIDSGHPERHSALITHELSRLNIDIPILSGFPILQFFISKRTVSLINMALVTYSTGQENPKSKVTFQQIVLWLKTLPPPNLRLCRQIIPAILFSLSTYAPTLQADPMENDRFYTDLIKKVLGIQKG